MSLRYIDWSACDSDVLAYLCVDRFIADMTGARALSTAFETGVIDYLANHEAADAEGTSQALGVDKRGCRLLFGMLRANGVVEPTEDEVFVRLTDGFVQALRFRDLLEAKLHFANLVAPDFLQLSTALLMKPQVFFERARIFQLFSYQRACERTQENLEQTARWMRITTALTRYEAQACIESFDFSPFYRMLDVGGNSGEFALRICQQYAALQATIYDLPLVCDIGQRHVTEQAASAEETARITFVPRDQTQSSLPVGHDLITFKSMLHDWPDEEMSDFLARAYQALPENGTVMIFERCDTEVRDVQIGYGQLPLMLFFRSYRQPAQYMKYLQEAGFHSIESTVVPLDMPFLLMTAKK